MDHQIKNMSKNKIKLMVNVVKIMEEWKPWNKYSLPNTPQTGIVFILFEIFLKIYKLKLCFTNDANANILTILT